MPHGDSLILTLVAGFVLAFAFGMAARRLRLSPLVGYLMAGVVVGPFTPGWVADGGIAAQLAEVGVILLMFGVGLHFSPQDLLSVRKVAAPGALIQMGLATALGWGLAVALGLPGVEGLLLGLCLSVASTVVVLRTLEERKAMKSEAGRIAIGWLVVQDLIVVVALVLLPLFLTGQTEPAALARDVGWQLLKVAGFVGLMLVVGGRALPWLLVRIAHTRSRELFTLGVLAIALGIAWIAYALFGASFALGAFVAGLVLNGSSLGHAAAERSLPLRDAFAVLFFVSVGMLFDPRILLRQPLALAGVVAIVLASGALAALIVARIARVDRPNASLLAASLPQIGEFSFVLAGLGVSLKAMSHATQSLVVAAAILSIALNPLLLRLADRRGGPESGAEAAA
ncbi:MAG: potassium transporter Kef [Phenylobacterium sp.]|uniref:cation:proton antiporter domain-containing protein n=1 Tax=Phenylobacterium sp. TaxID=1871053 RepID=UPI0025ED3526|nr:cation:proton antiporter [Phenylobacterium sp.]MBI1197304.1 potassium transporter Kef [Phenylobacterium sp.]